MSATKQPNPIDTHVGARVRLRRMLLGLSQEKLAEHLDLTFQQVQKYERGINRIGASRLLQIATSLGVPVSYFFEEAPAPQATPAAGASSVETDASILKFLHSREGLELNRAFQKVRDPKARKAVIGLLRSIAEEADAPAQRNVAA